MAGVADHKAHFNLPLVESLTATLWAPTRSSDTVSSEPAFGVLCMRRHNAICPMASASVAASLNKGLNLS